MLTPFFKWRGYVLSGEIALKNNHYCHYVSAFNLFAPTYVCMYAAGAWCGQQHWMMCHVTSKSTNCKVGDKRTLKLLLFPSLVPGVQSNNMGIVQTRVYLTSLVCQQALREIFVCRCKLRGKDFITNWTNGIGSRVLTEVCAYVNARLFYYYYYDATFNWHC